MALWRKVRPVLAHCLRSALMSSCCVLPGEPLEIDFDYRVGPPPGPAAPGTLLARLGNNECVGFTLSTVCQPAHALHVPVVAALGSHLRQTAVPALATSQEAHQPDRGASGDPGVAEVVREVARVADVVVVPVNKAGIGSGRSRRRRMTWTRSLRRS